MKTKEKISVFEGWHPVTSKLDGPICLACGKKGHKFDECPNDPISAERYCENFGIIYDPITVSDPYDDVDFLDLEYDELEGDRLCDLERGN